MDYRISIDSLNLSDNEISDDACTQLGKLIEAQHINLEHLDLSQNQKLTADGLIVLLQFSAKDLHLTSMNLSKCSIEMTSSESKLKFIEILKQNISLSELNLEGNPITEDKNLMETIKEELYINNQIKKHITASWMTAVSKKDRKQMAKRY